MNSADDTESHRLFSAWMLASAPYRSSDRFPVSSTRHATPWPLSSLQSCHRNETHPLYFRVVNSQTAPCQICREILAQSNAHHWNHFIKLRSAISSRGSFRARWTQRVPKEISAVKTDARFAEGRTGEVLLVLWISLETWNYWWFWVSHEIAPD